MRSWKFFRFVTSTLVSVYESGFLQEEQEGSAFSVETMRMSFNPSATALSVEEGRKRVMEDEWAKYKAEPNDAARIGHLKMAARLGHPMAQCPLGIHYLVKRKVDKAIEQFEEAKKAFDRGDHVDANHRKAAYDIFDGLGTCYKNKSELATTDDERLMWEDAALKMFEQAGDYDQGLCSVYAAQILEKKGRRKGAVEWYARGEEYSALFLRSDHLGLVEDVDNALQRARDRKRQRPDESDESADGVLVKELEAVVRKHRSINHDYVEDCEEE